MLATLPMDDEHNLAGHLVDIGDDLCDQYTYESLTRSHCRLWRLPCRREIISQSSEVWPCLSAFRHSHDVELLSATLDPLQLGLLSLLQLSGDQRFSGPHAA